MRKYKELFERHRVEFHKYFDLNLFHFIDYITGFDICKFEDEIKVPKNRSMGGHIASKYGEAASVLVLKLIIGE